MSHPTCITYGCKYELDLDGQITCVICGTMNNEVNISGSYNGSTPGSEPVNEGSIPLPEAKFDLNESGYGYDELKDFDEYKDNRKSKITPFMGPSR